MKQLWKYIGVSIGVIGVMIVGFLLGRNQLSLRPMADTISVAQLKKLLPRKNFTLVNVHTPYEGEIEKTDAFIAYDKFVEQSALLPKDKDTSIILYCKTGRMSEEALGTVRKLGYTNVRHLRGGMDGWQKSEGQLLDLP